MSQKKTHIITHPYKYAPAFKKSVAYFSMEFAIDQSLKTYSGGLGFLAGSHMRSVYDLKQNVIGIGILWKFGYYDQDRKEDNSMTVMFRQKFYNFIHDTDIRFQIDIMGRHTWVGVFTLDAETFGTAPMFFLTTDVDGNDYDQRKISFHLYDSDPAIKISQCILLGIGGAKFLDVINYQPDIYHLNEAHALSSVFYLYQKYGNIEDIKKRLVFTTHTPEEAGNEKHNIYQLAHLGFFAGLHLRDVRPMTGIEDDIFNHSLVALRLSHISNAVSKLHGEVSRKMWSDYAGICPITHITNAQNKKYWVDKHLERHRLKGNTEGIAERKKDLKQRLFKVVADQTGKLFDPDVLTIVWARRFAAYKRPDLLTRDVERFKQLMNNKGYPIQFIWAGKPYPKDENAVNIFNRLHHLNYFVENMAILTGYELGLSKLMKDGADLWLNTPIVTREASGTSGMTAAMNGAINFSTYDGWVCEFATKENSFVVPVAPNDSDFVRDKTDIDNFFEMLEKQILPMYYDEPEKWLKMQLQSMNDVSLFFDSDRMATEYYEKVYNSSDI
jgi:glycogen phosphorylase